MMNDIIQGNERYRLPWEIRHFLLEHCLLMMQAWSIRQWTNIIFAHILIAYVFLRTTCYLASGISGYLRLVGVIDIRNPRISLVSDVKFKDISIYSSL